MVAPGLHALSQAAGSGDCCGVGWKAVGPLSWSTDLGQGHRSLVGRRAEASDAPTSAVHRRWVYC